MNESVPPRPAGSGSPHRDRDLPSVRPTRIIAYAWGEKYIGELLSMTLPALVAPGNLPAVAAACPCELVILTEEAVFSRLMADPVVRGIQALCPLRLVGLDDLIPAPDKYGIALTHVLHRGFADLGPAMTDTWLMFLNADFVLADGSLRNLVRHLAAGRRIVASPSYCVNSEDAVPLLLERVDARTRALSLAPREMARLVLRHRHNTIRGKTVNQTAFSMRYVDQFYWLVDDDTLLGHQMPIAIVGMQPERHLAEPNSYWDHGLMKEFFPATEPFVMGDSDEFLMLELRGKSVAQDQIRVGWPEPSEIARNTISFLTPYQKEMARHPLTLHAGDLPDGVGEGRARLRAFVDSVLAHVPAALPSHIDHPQWDYHWPGFVQARHRYLSARLGSATEESEPPPALGELDRVWWKLDGLEKSHVRRRAQLVELMKRQRDAVSAVLTRVEESVEVRRAEIDERLVRALDAIAPPARDETVGLNRVVRLGPDEAPFGAAASNRQEPWVAPVLETAGEWAAFEDNVRARKEVLAKALDFIDRHYTDRLQQLDEEFASTRAGLRFDYDRLTRRRVASAAIPHVMVRQGPQTSDAPVAGVIRRFASTFYRRHYGRLPRVQPLHPYWAAMRHLVRLVDAAAQEGAANVLVVVGAGSDLAETVADHLPGRHAQVSLAELMHGNLIKAFGSPPDFDLCVCGVGTAALANFADIVSAVAPCMRAGGKIIGFHPNFAGGPLPIDGANLPWDKLGAPSSAQIHYAGSPRSARVVRSYHRMLTGGSSRLVRLARIAATLPIITPSAVAANRREAAAPADGSARAPAHCTSVTIEVTV